MNRRGAEPRQCIEVRLGSVAEMYGQPITRIALVQTPHQGIAMRLGDDGGCTDARHQRVATDYSFHDAICKAIMKLR